MDFGYRVTHKNDGGLSEEEILKACGIDPRMGFDYIALTSDGDVVVLDSCGNWRCLPDSLEVSLFFEN